MATHSNVHKHTRAHHAADELSQKATEALRETIHDLRERSDDVKATVQEYVHQKPFKALGIAALAGMALALIIRR